jgi:hypothetical protein
MLHHENYNQGLKQAYGNCFSIQTDCTYINTFPKTLAKKLIEIKLWAKFDESNFDGINIYATAQSMGRTVSISGIDFTVSYYSQDDEWNRTLVIQQAGTEFSTGRFRLNIPAASLPALIGNYSFEVEAVAIRREKRIYAKNSFNHFGIYQMAIRNKNKIGFLEITKAEE